MRLYLFNLFALWLFFSSNAFAADVCSRSERMQSALERMTQKSCDQINEEDLSKITVLRIADFGGIFVPKQGDFNGLTNLWFLELNVSGSRFSDLPSNLLKDLKNLLDFRIFSVSYNHWGKPKDFFPQGFFNYSNSLIRLEVEGNGDLELRSFTHYESLKSLKSIITWSKQLGSIGKNDLEFLVNLETLLLNRSGISQIHPEAFSKLGNLKSKHID